MSKEEEGEEGEDSPIIFEGGSASFKCGFGGDIYPLVFPSTVLRSSGILVSPIKKGDVEDWDGIEELWHHAFYNLLKTAPEEHPVLIVRNPFASVSDGEKHTQIMFETFNVPALLHDNYCDTATLSLLGNSPNLNSRSSPFTQDEFGKSSGIVVDCGLEETRILPLVKGHRRKAQEERVPGGGEWITNYINSKISLKTKVDALKLRLSPLVHEYQIHVEEKVFTLEVEEMLKSFLTETKIDEVVGDCLNALKDEEVLFSNIVIHGKTCTIKGFSESLVQAVESYLGIPNLEKACQKRRNTCTTSNNNNSKEGVERRNRLEVFPQEIIDIITSFSYYSCGVRNGRGSSSSSSEEKKESEEEKERRNLIENGAFVGGSLFSLAPCVQELWMSKAEYNESGPNLVIRKE